jgi:hypothetical protein
VRNFFRKWPPLRLPWGGAAEEEEEAVNDNFDTFDRMRYRERHLIVLLTTSPIITTKSEESIINYSPELVLLTRDPQRC